MLKRSERAIVRMWSWCVVWIEILPKNRCDENESKKAGGADTDWDAVILVRAPEQWTNDHTQGSRDTDTLQDGEE